MSTDCNFAIRLLLVALEPLRFLTHVWLSHLDAAKTGKRYPLYCLLDDRSSPVIAVLQRISHMLLSDEGEGRLLFVWRPLCPSFQQWCQLYPEQVGSVQHVFMSVLCDPNADPAFVDFVSDLWDSSNVCCLRPGLARDLKRAGFTSASFRRDAIFASILIDVLSYTPDWNLTASFREPNSILSRHIVFLTNSLYL